MQRPILYSFRRCPYAMRARLALKYADITVELREIDLKRKPAAMLAISPKGTVPVLQLPNGEVLDESLDIMYWACAHKAPHLAAYGNPELGTSLISRNDQIFKPLLDRYKYPNRYETPDATSFSTQNRTAAVSQYLAPLNECLQVTSYLLGAKPSLADMAIMPFVRQFMLVNEEWFRSQTELTALTRWLDEWLATSLFAQIMHKYPVWQEGDTTQML